MIRDRKNNETLQNDTKAAHYEHELKQGDVFKLGRIQLRVKEMFVVSDNEGYKTDAEAEDVIDLNTLARQHQHNVETQGKF